MFSEKSKAPAALDPFDSKTLILTRNGVDDSFTFKERKRAGGGSARSGLGRVVPIVLTIIPTVHYERPVSSSCGSPGVSSSGPRRPCRPWRGGNSGLRGGRENQSRLSRRLGCSKVEWE